MLGSKKQTKMNLKTKKMKRKTRMEKATTVQCREAPVITNLISISKIFREMLTTSTLIISFMLKTIRLS